MIVLARQLAPSISQTARLARSWYTVVWLVPTKCDPRKDALVNDICWVMGAQGSLMRVGSEAPSQIADRMNAGYEPPAYLQKKKGGKNVCS